MNAGFEGIELGGGNLTPLPSLVALNENSDLNTGASDWDGNGTCVDDEEPEGVVIVMCNGTIPDVEPR